MCANCEYVWTVKMHSSDLCVALKERDLNDIYEKERNIENSPFKLLLLPLSLQQKQGGRLCAQRAGTRIFSFILKSGTKRYI